MRPGLDLNPQTLFHCLLRTFEYWLGFNLMHLKYWPCIIVCVRFGWLVCLSQTDISWRQIGRPMLQCNEPSTWLLTTLAV